MSWRGWLIFAALCVIWGVPYFFIKLAIAEVPPLLVAWGRITLATLILLPIAWRRGTLRGMLAHAGAICAFALAELIVPFSLIATGESWVSSSLAGVLAATVPMMVLLLSPLFGVKETLGTRRIIGLLTGFIGVVVLLGVGTVAGARGWTGVACILISAVGYGFGALIVQRYLHGTDELAAVTASLSVASLVLAGPAWWHAPHRWPSAMALTSIAVLGVLCTAIALVLLFMLIRQAGASRTAIITYVNPAVAALLGVAVLHERFGVGGALGLALILIGSWFATHRPVRAQS